MKKKKILWIFCNCDVENRRKLRIIQDQLKSEGLPNTLKFPYPNRATVSASKKNIDLVIERYIKFCKCYDVVEID